MKTRGELGHLLGSYMTSPNLRTARISNAESFMCGNK